MTTLKNSTFTFVLAIGAALAGCAADATQGGMGGGSGSGMGSGDGSGSGSGSGSGGETQSLTLAGKYSVQSQFDISQNMPGTVGTVFNNFTAAASDPGKWLLDLIISKTSGIVQQGLQLAEPFLSGYIDDQINQYAPAFVQTIEQVGSDLGQMAQKFGVNETYDVTGGSGAYTAVDTAVGLHFKVDSLEEDFAFSDYNEQNIVVNNVPVTLDASGKLSIGEHQLPVSYGKVIRLGLDNMVIPNVDPNASDLGTLLTDLIDCDSVGQALADNVGLIGQSTWSSLCTAGLQAGAQEIYTQINNIDSSALTFDLTGAAKAVDTDHDYKADSLQLGKWTGTLSYAGTPAPLAAATFTGAKM